MRTIALLTVALCSSPVASAAQDAPRSYRIADGTYSIDVTFAPGRLTVLEPNKTSVYTEVSPGVYHFVNADNQNIEYGLRVIDDETLEAFKPGVNGPGTGVPGTTLTLVKAIPMGESTAEDEEKFSAVAEKYAALTESDPDNVHVWAACAATAMARASGGEAAFRAYAAQAAQMLKPIMVDASKSPCSDAIPDDVWKGMQ